ncbi:uncharacterized protein LOC125048358 [Penaeus chinensis]|uniref:uncharacterized protein LOC125048358 n=1 Tax=Penaeus chinensis TaxID=139456 RepID=UPI001FB70D15|nr:uncharacterized protein LOC125048358 [Penaeus chinensis]
MYSSAVTVRLPHVLSKGRRGISTSVSSDLKESGCGDYGCAFYFASAMHRGRGGIGQSLILSQKAEPAIVAREMQPQSHYKSRAREVPVQQISETKEGPWQESPDKWAKSIWDESPTKQGLWQESPSKQGVWQESPSKDSLWQESPRKQGACLVSHSKEGTHPISQDVWRELPSQQNLSPMEKQFEEAGKFFASMTISATSSRGQTQNPFACKTTFGMMDGSKQGQRQSEDLQASTTAFAKVSPPVNPASHGNMTSCICNRPKRRIWCRKCGSLILGRINIVCQKHTQVMYLSDHRNCWSCKASLEHLTELDDDVVFPGAKGKEAPMRKNRVANRQE